MKILSQNLLQYCNNSLNSAPDYSSFVLQKTKELYLGDNVTVNGIP